MAAPPLNPANFGVVVSEPAPSEPPKPEASLARSVSMSMLWVGVGNIVSKLARVAALYYVLDTISKTEFGIAQTALSVFSILQAVTELGLGVALIQAKSLTRSQLDSLFWLSAFISGGLYAVVFLLAFPLGTFYEAPQLTPLLQVQALGVVLFSLYFISKSQLAKELAFGRITLADNISSLLSAGVMIGLAAAGASVWSIILGELATRGFELLFYQTLRPFRPRFRYRFAEVKPLLNFGVYATFTRLLTRCYIDADLLILGKVRGLEVAGGYAFAYRVVFDIQSSLTSMTNQVAYPTFSRLQDNKPELARYLFGLARASTLLIGIAMAILFVAPETALTALGFDNWVSSAPIIRILAFVGLVRAVLPILPYVLQAVGQVKESFYMNLIYALILPPAFYLAARFGESEQTVAYMWVTVYPVVSLILLHMVAKSLDISILKLTSKVYGGTLVVLVIGVVLYGVNQLLAQSEWAVGLQALALLLVGLGLGAAWVFWREREFIEVIFKKKKKT